MTTAIRPHRLREGELVHFYVTAGTGPPLILLHGFPQTWQQWQPLIERLAGRFRVVAPALRGLGGVPGPPSGYDKHTMADDVHAVLAAECGTEPALVCGHDIGAHVALALALRHRSAVRGLVLVGPPPPGTAEMQRIRALPRTWHLGFHASTDVAQLLITGRERAYIDQFIRSRIADPAAISTEEIDRYAEAYTAPGALRAAMEWYRALPLDGELNRAALAEGGLLDIPVAAVGSSETATTASLESALSEIARRGSAVVVDNSGHWIPQEAPDELAAVILAVHRASRATEQSDD